MKLLIIGVQGQVARSLVELAEPRGIDLLAQGPPELDLTNPETLERAIERFQPDYVINAAAYTAVDKAEEEGGLAIAINRYGPGALAAICAERDIPLIHISTDYVYDGSKDGFYVETDKTNPLGMYGYSKLEGDRAVAAANPQHIILRTAWVYSPFGHNFVKTMLRLAETRDELNVVDDQHGCPSYAPHIAEGILQVIEKLAQTEDRQALWGIYHMAGAGETTWCGLAREIFTRSQEQGGPSAQVHAITTAEYPTPAKRPANSRLDCSKLTKIFAITLPDWREGVADCVTRLLQQKD